MEITQELLAANNGKDINVALLVPDLEAYLDEAITHEIESFADHFAETTGEDPQKWAESQGKVFFSDFAEYSYHDLLMEWAETAIDVINERLGGAATIHSFDRSTARGGTGLWGQERAYLPALIDVDADKLLRMYVERFGSVDINDGRGISGFIRTCEDDYWVLLSVLRGLIPEDETQQPVEDEVWEWSELDIPFGEAGEALYAG